MRIKPHEFMLKFMPHTRWAEGSGLLIVIAFFLGGVSGGLYLTSLYTDNLVGMFTGWLLVLVVGMADMAHLHKPLRFWRMLLRPGSSWIARGFIFITLFIVCAAVQLALTYWLPGTAGEIVFKVLAGIFAVGIIIYSGFVMNNVKAIRLWNSSMMTLLFIASSLVGGTAVLYIITIGQSAAQIETVRSALQIMLALYAVILGLYLWLETNDNPAARNSVALIIKGNLAYIFWIAVVLVGIVVPLSILFLTGAGEVALLDTGAIFVVIGTFALRYILLRGGVYSPLAPSPDA